MAKPPKKKRKPGSPEHLPESEVVTSERELIVVAEPDYGLRSTSEGATSVTGANIGPLNDFLASEGVTLRPLFGVSEERLLARTAEMVADVPDLSVYYRVEAPDERLDDLANRLQNMDGIEAAYIKPPTEPAQMRLNDMLPLAEEAPPVTPDFTARQLYLDPAPGGIDARYAWTRNGGLGLNVGIIDIEGAWRFTQEDLLQNQGGVIGGTQSTDIAWRNHGTAVVGEFGADVNVFGVTGICPAANVRAISIFGGTGSAGAIRQAADALNAGDIILIELHRPGPRFNFQVRGDQMGYIAIEWWPDDFAAIQYATGNGVIVVEAAGNGAENLDDPVYSVRPNFFPPSWTNPFNRANRDSGAVIVGAGAPPPNTHGRNHGNDRSRLAFSNYGALIDAQGWGREVTTCGYGDLQGGADENLWYTDTFSGTSSASPIIVGALGCMQGVLRAHNGPPLTPATARNILRTTGSPQQDEPGRPATQRIGNRPDLRQAITQLVGKPEEFKGFQYAVKFVCGKSDGEVVAPGNYFTAINVHNPTYDGIRFRKKVAVALPGEQPGPVSNFFDAKLGPDEALEIDCQDIFKHASSDAPFLKGFVVIESDVELDVVAVYTAAGATEYIETFHTERVWPRRLETGLPDLVPVPDPTGSFCRRDNQGNLIVTVKNQGTAGAGPSVTEVDFSGFGNVSNPTPQLLPGASVDLLFPIPSGCFDPDCDFRIIVDANHQVVESNEANNTASGTCIG